MIQGKTRPVVGALALQGDFAAHTATMERLGADVVAVRKVAQLEDIDGLIIPGGESTTLIRLMEVFEFWEPLQRWIGDGHPVFGTCAGTILLANEVLGPTQKSLGLIDITVERNSYGRQRDSFEGTGSFRPTPEKEEEIEMIFIRAPRIIRMGAHIEALGDCRGDTVVARQEHVLVATFHPELGTGSAIHEYFLQMVITARG